MPQNEYKHAFFGPMVLITEKRVHYIVVYRHSIGNSSLNEPNHLSAGKTYSIVVINNPLPKRYSYEESIHYDVLVATQTYQHLCVKKNREIIRKPILPSELTFWYFITHWWLRGK